MALDNVVTIKILALLTVAICLKFFYVILASGAKRTRAPEDGFQLQLNKNSVDKDREQFPEQERWHRIVINDLENIPITLILLWIAVIVQGNNETNVAFAVSFLVGRIVHTICYVRALMPWRSLGWLLGFLSTLGLMGNIIYGAFK